MTDNIELPPLPTSILAHIATLDPCTNLGSWIKDYARAAILADRPRQAPAPVEVSRLADEAKRLARTLFESDDMRGYDALVAAIDRLGLASTPVGEVPVAVGKCSHQACLWKMECLPGHCRDAGEPQKPELTPMQQHVLHGGWRCHFCGFDGQDNTQANFFCSNCRRHK